MATIPGVADGELIRTSWGDAVADELNSNVVKRTGATMTGNLTMASGSVIVNAAAPTDPNHLTNKTYVDDTTVSRAGDTMTGTLTMASGSVVSCAAAPTSSFHLTNKVYVDDIRTDSVAVAGATMTGNLIVTGNPTVASGVALLDTGQIQGAYGDAAGGPSLYLRRAGSALTVGDHFVRFIVGASTIAGSCALGGGNTVVYNTSSDRRLKNDLGPVVDGLDRVRQLQPRQLAWKSDGTQFEGFIADEVQPVAPYAVTGEPDAVLPPSDEFDPGGIDPQQLDNSKLIALLVAAVQELSAKVDALEGGG